MAIRVRVQNFQSIEDQTVDIDGFTVITGQNNAGKTALIRAIRGVFTNPSVGSLLRRGTNYLTVTIDFPNGNQIKWEKGWERPHQKGKAINQYTLNGKVLALVGRGVPPELDILGIREVQASSDALWPQIADQFSGSLFLVDRSGATIAEALSDVEKVGKLTNALKAVQKDRRSIDAEMKIRSKDLKQQQDLLAKYAGLEGVAESVRALSTIKEGLNQQEEYLHGLGILSARHRQSMSAVNSLIGFHLGLVPEDQTDSIRVRQRQVQMVSSLRERLHVQQRHVNSLYGFNLPVFPDSSRAERLLKALPLVRSYRDQYRAADSRKRQYEGMGDVSLMTPQSAIDLQAHRRDVHSLRGAWARVQKECQGYGAFREVHLPEPSPLLQGLQKVRDVSRIRRNLTDAVAHLYSVEAQHKQISDQLRASEQEVEMLLGKRGICPTCNRIHEGPHEA